MTTRWPLRGSGAGWAGVFAVSLGGACAPAPTVAPPAAPHVAVPSAETSLHATAWETLTIESLGLVLTLPDGPGWTSRQEAHLGFRALHAATGSELRVRVWPDQRGVTPDACAARARLTWPELPQPGDPGAIDDRPLLAPAGYRGRMIIAVTTLADGTLEGRLSAVGAAIGRCLAVSFRTRARGGAAERVVAESLAVVAEGTVDQLAMVTIEDRVPRRDSL